jgi:hypothetical protein
MENQFQYFDPTDPFETCNYMLSIPEHALAPGFNWVGSGGYFTQKPLTASRFGSSHASSLDSPATSTSRRGSISSSSSASSSPKRSIPHSGPSLSTATSSRSRTNTRSPSFPSSETSSRSSSSSSLHAYGIQIQTSDPSTPSWRCAYPSCISRATFTRGCDLRKHYNRHSKHLFCRVEGCPRSQRVAAAVAENCDGALSGGFSSQKDLERHEAQHNPSIKCDWKGCEGERCGRVFSRMDNMRDHVSRIHCPKKGEVRR